MRSWQRTVTRSPPISVVVIDFFGGGCADANERGGVDDAADTTEIEFEEDFEDGDVER